MFTIVWFLLLGHKRKDKIQRSLGRELKQLASRSKKEDKHRTVYFIILKMISCSVEG